jgi:hypothetical protein
VWSHMEKEGRYCIEVASISKQIEGPKRPWSFRQSKGCDEWFELAKKMRDGCPLQSLVTTIGHSHLNQSDPLLEEFLSPFSLQSLSPKTHGLGPLTWSGLKPFSQSLSTRPRVSQLDILLFNIPPVLW